MAGAGNRKPNGAAMTGAPNNFNGTDIAALVEDYPIGPEFLRRFEAISRDELRALQETRFAEVLCRAGGQRVPCWVPLAGGFPLTADLSRPRYAIPATISRT